MEQLASVGAAFECVYRKRVNKLISIAKILN